jgi:hypothetical protein
MFRTNLKNCFTLMKDHRVALYSLAFLLCWLLVPRPAAFGCNLTDLTLNSVAPGPGENYTISMTACYGYGMTGSTKGADNDTRTVAIAWYSTDPSFMVVGFGPPSMVGTYSGCTMPGSNMGPQGSPYNSQGTIMYIDPGYYMIPPCVDQPYGCVGSTALCGNVGQQCVVYTVEVTQVPDSLRIFGAEGGGNPLAGCYPNADMMIDFTLLPARWGSIAARLAGDAMQVEWTSLQELNADFYMVERACGDGVFTEIGIVQAFGNSISPRSYSFIDPHPLHGEQQYRLVLVDHDGRTSMSQAVSARYGGAGTLEWVTVGPVPTRGPLKLSFAETDREERLRFSLASMDGKLVVDQPIEAKLGVNEIALDLTDVLDGVYFVSLKGVDKALSYRIVKI